MRLPTFSCEDFESALINPQQHSQLLMELHSKLFNNQHLNSLESITDKYNVTLESSADPDVAYQHYTFQERLVMMHKLIEHLIRCQEHSSVQKSKLNSLLVPSKPFATDMNGNELYHFGHDLANRLFYISPSNLNWRTLATTADQIQQACDVLYPSDPVKICILKIINHHHHSKIQSHPSSPHSTNKFAPKRSKPFRYQVPHRTCIQCSIQESHYNHDHNLLTCGQCKTSYHVKCHDPPLASIPIRYRYFVWTCEHCKFCESCKVDQHGDQMLICDECDRAFHTYCLNPPLLEIPTGSWKCNDCNERQVGQPDNDYQKIPTCEDCVFFEEDHDDDEINLVNPNDEFVEIESTTLMKELSTAQRMRDDLIHEEGFVSGRVSENALCLDDEFSHCEEQVTRALLRKRLSNITHIRSIVHHVTNLECIHALRTNHEDCEMVIDELLSGNHACMHRLRKKIANGNHDDDDPFHDEDDDDDDDLIVSEESDTDYHAPRSTGGDVKYNKHQSLRMYRNPLSGFCDPITQEELIDPYISKYGHVLSYSTWKKVLLEKAVKDHCPFTKKPLGLDDLKRLTMENIHEYQQELNQYPLDTVK
ncbi:histone-lysine N-methyltransferase [Acrasis kona]|uniref:Histone-lysine N-methyltransferase n=1 Tax=Acrasis kona TaxID=1008807 RepID=A0AAW2Z0G9_9EUKA